MADTRHLVRHILWGSAGHAKVLAELIALRGGRVVALFDRQQVASALPGVPLFIGEAGFARWLADAEDTHTVIAAAAIGGARGRDRLALLDLFQRHGLRQDSLLHPEASVSPSALLGPGCQVLAQAMVGASARLGAACIVNHRASVDHACVLGDGVHIAPGATLCGCVTVGEAAMVGAGAVVLPRLSIGPDAIVGAGAVVTRNVPPGAVVAGNPARQLEAATANSLPTH